MPKHKILQEDQDYTFRSYFDLSEDPDDILAEFDYRLIVEELLLPKTTTKLVNIPEMEQKIKRILPFIRLNNEATRRETLVSPILLEIVDYCHCQLRIEYPIKVNKWLKGTLDYLLRSQNSLLVIEAKNDDLTKGFTQLAVQLIALSYIEEQNVFYGAVTIGNIWQFGKLDRHQQIIVQDINLFRVPDDLESLASVLVGILEGVEENVVNIKS